MARKTTDTTKAAEAALNDYILAQLEARDEHEVRVSASNAVRRELVNNARLRYVAALAAVFGSERAIPAFYRKVTPTH